MSCNHGPDKQKSYRTEDDSKTENGKRYSRKILRQICQCGQVVQERPGEWQEQG